MIHLRCPASGEIWSVNDESEIPDGQVFERVNKFNVIVADRRPVAVFGTSVREGMIQAVQLAQRNPMVISSA